MELRELTVIRRLVPFAIVPLAVVATVLAAAPWLRAYPAGVLAAPLFGAAVLGVLVPVVTVGIGVRRLWQTALIGLVLYVFFTLLVALHEPVGFADLYDGIAHGPAQILSFALPLVSPRTLLVAPVTLTWVAGAIVGECVARTWHSLLPYVTLLVTFGLAYAASVRGVTSSSDGRRYDTLLAGALLLTLLLMRAAQAWIEQDLDAETAQADGVLPLRGLAVGAVVSLVVALVAGAVVQSSAFSGPPRKASRVPPIDRATLSSPVGFIAGLRPNDPASKGRPEFTVTVDRRASAYVGIADVDDYDGDGWSFARTFRPSGGVVPDETDPGLRPSGHTVTQQYRIASGGLNGAPWMPFVYRPERVIGTSVDVDTSSGMVVPAEGLRSGEDYTVRSAAFPGSITALPATAAVATSTPPSYLGIPGVVGRSLGTVVSAFAAETRTGSGNQLAFLRALTRDLQTNYRLSGGPIRTTAPTGASSSGRPTPSPTGSSPRSGGTGFANVLASILGPNRAASPEQYATLVALVARQIGVPSRLVTGFRLGRSATVAPGPHRVTGADAWTWVEVPVQGRGWVVLDPSPSTFGAQRRQPSASARPSPSPTPTVTPNGLVTQAPNGNAVAPRSSTGGHHRVSSTSLTVVIGAAVGGLVVLVLLGLITRKWVRRRRRRRNGDPRTRVVGAWQESLDMLAEAGLTDLSSSTSAEVAARARERFGGETGAQARYIGDSANAAIFSPTSWVGAGEADAVWRAHTVLRRSVHEHLPWSRRVTAGLRYHRAPRARRQRGPASWTSTPRRPGGATRRHRAH
ncbi:transglutaminase domain-containing protein [uncultured Jatrophihabitans sp.]|uniref:transglutaminase family protein n=1 Tax=uncultured Jatrophihabitans sp. TaxID=1610747 RepID=UPI0035CC6CC1